MPIPLSMWRPWIDSGFEAHWFSQPVFNLDEYTVSPLICYESLLVWPLLWSMVYEPDSVMAIGNFWWARNTCLMKQQLRIYLAWMRLFEFNFILSQNH